MELKSNKFPSRRSRRRRRRRRRRRSRSRSDAAFETDEPNKFRRLVFGTRQSGWEIRSELKFNSFQKKGGAVAESSEAQ